MASYQRAKRNKLEACAECKAAFAAYQKERRAGNIESRKKLAGCGTAAKYQRVMRQGGTPCDECKAAHAEYRRNRRAELADAS